MSEVEFVAPISCFSVSFWFAENGSASTTCASSFEVESMVISSVVFLSEWKLSTKTTSTGLSSVVGFVGELSLQIFSTILSTRGVERALLGPGEADVLIGEFMKTSGLEDAAFLNVAPEKVVSDVEIF